MHRLKVFLAFTCLQVSIFWVGASIQYQPARAAEAAESTDEKHETSQGGVETSQSTHDVTKSGDDTPRDEHETSRGEQTRSDVDQESQRVPQTHPSSNDDGSSFASLQYPYPANAENLNRDATYSLNGVEYKFVEQIGREYVFERVSDHERSTFESVTEFEVVDDPVAQVEKDMGVIPKLQGQMYELFTEAIPSVTELQKSVDDFNTAAGSVNKEATEETVLRALEEMEQHYAQILQKVDTVTRSNAAIEAFLRRGLALCDDMHKRADRLTNRMYLVRKVDALCASLHDESSALTLEQYEYAEAVKRSKTRIESLRRAVKLVSDLRDVQVRFDKYLTEIGPTGEQLKSVLQEVEALTNKATSSLEVQERRMRARMLQSALSSFETQVKSLTSDAEIFIKRFETLKPLQKLCEMYSHEDIQIVAEEIDKFRNLTQKVESTARTLEEETRRASGALAALREFTVSYEVMDSDIFRSGLGRVTRRMHAISAAAAGDLGLKAAEEQFSAALHSLMEAVNSGNVDSVENKLQVAAQHLKAHVKASEAAQELLDSRLQLARELRADLRRLSSFTTNDEEEKMLEDTERQVSERHDSLEAHSQIAHSSVLSDRWDAAVQRAVTLLLDASDNSLSEGEAKQARIKRQLDLHSTEPDAIDRLTNLCQEASEDVRSAAAASAAFSRCRATEGLRETMEKAPPGGGESLYDRLSKRWDKNLKRRERTEASLTHLCSAVESLKEGFRRKGLTEELGRLAAEVRPLVEHLKRGCAQEEGVAADLRCRCEVEDSLEALEQLLKSPPTRGFESLVKDSLQNILRAALSTAAAHLEKAAAAEPTAAKILSRHRGGEEAGEAAQDLRDLPTEELAAAGDLQEQLSFANEALAIFHTMKQAPDASSVIQGVPFSARGISEESFPAAAQALEAKAHTLADSVREIYDAVEGYQAQQKRRVQMSLKEVLLSIDAALQKLKSKEELATSEHHRRRLKEQENVYMKARDEVFACISGSSMQVKDAKACFTALLKTVVSSAVYAVEQAQQLQTQAEELEASSPTDFETLDKIVAKCNQAMEEADLAHDGLDLYARSPVLTLIEAAEADTSRGAEGTDVSLKETAETAEDNLQRVEERVRELREHVRMRSEASAGKLRSSISRALAAVQGGLEAVRSLAADPTDQQLFADMVGDLEKMLVSASPGGDLAEQRRGFENAAEQMMEKLLTMAAGGLRALRQETEAESRLYGTGADASALLSDHAERRKSVCEELPQRLQLVKKALAVREEIEHADESLASRDRERCQQLVAEAESLQEQLRLLCEEATRRSDLYAHEAKQKLKTMSDTAEDTLRPLLQTLLAAGDPKQAATRLKELIASVGALQSRVSSPSFPMEVEEQRRHILQRLVEVPSDLQDLCKGDIEKVRGYIDTLAPRLLLSVIRDDIEEAVWGDLSRCQQLVGVAKALLNAYTVIDGDRHATEQQQPSGAGRSEQDEFRRPQMRAKYHECVAQGEAIDAQLVVVRRRLDEKMTALKQSASRLVNEAVLTVEEAIVKVEAERASDVNPASTCADGEARTEEIKRALKNSFDELKNPASEWGTPSYATAIRSVIGRMLTALLQRAEMHAEVGRKLVPVIQKCVAGGHSCEDLGGGVDASQVANEAQQHSKIQEHAKAAAQWLKLYQDCVTVEDLIDIANNTTGGPSSSKLPDWAVRLTTEVRGMEEMAQRLSQQLSLRAEALTHAVETRLEPVVLGLQRGIEAVDELLEDAMDNYLVDEGQKLKEKLQQALKELQELQQRSGQAVTASESEERVTAVLHMLVTHASDLVEEATKKEKMISDCLKDPRECSVPQAARDMAIALSGVLDELAASTKVSSLTLNILVDSTASSFTIDIVQNTPWLKSDPSSPTLMQRANTLWMELERLETRIPVLAVEIRSHRGAGSQQRLLAEVVSLVASGFQKVDEVDAVDEDTKRERHSKFDSLLETVEGIQGAAIPVRVEAEVREVFRTALAEAARQVALAKERLEAAKNLVETPDVDVITPGSLASTKSSAETKIDEGYGRATAAKLLLAVVDRGVDGSQRRRETLDRLAGERDLSRADAILADAEMCKSEVHRLRTGIVDRESFASQMAAESLNSLVELLKDVVTELENEGTTRDCPEVVLPFTARLNALLGLVEVLRDNWIFPSSLSEYVLLMEACAREFLTTASTSVAAAQHLRSLARKHASVVPSPLGTQHGSQQSVAQAFYEQGGNFVHIASVALDGVWSVLTAGEVSVPGEGRTVTIALEPRVRSYFTSQATKVATDLAEVKEQLNVNQLKSIIQAQQELLVDLATGRVNQVVDAFEEGLRHLTGLLQKTPPERQWHVQQSHQLFKNSVDALTLYRDSPGFPGSSEELYKQIGEALSSCLQSAQENLENGNVSVMQAAMFVSTLDQSSEQDEKEHTLSQATSAATLASDHLTLAAIGLDTVSRCSHAVTTAKRGGRTPSAHDGTPLQEKHTALRDKARNLEEKIQQVRQQLDSRGGVTGGERALGTLASQQTAADAETSSLTSTASTSSPDLEAAAVEELQRRLTSAAQHLQLANERRQEIEKCIAKPDECDELVMPQDDIPAASGTIRSYLMEPALRAEEQLKAFINDVLPEETATDEASAGPSQEAVVAEEVEDPLMAGVLTSVLGSRELPPSVRGRLQLMDPTFKMQQRAEELLAATVDAKDGALQTALDLRAAMVLRRVQSSLDDCALRVDEEHAACNCGERDYAPFLRQELQLLNGNVMEIYNGMGSTAEVQDCGPVLGQLMRRLVEHGTMLMDAATDAAETARDRLSDPTSSRGTAAAEAISQAEQNIEVAGHQVSLTRSFVRALNEVVSAASALEILDGVELFVAQRDLAPFVADGEELLRRADSVEKMIADAKKRVHDRQHSDAHSFADNVRALIRILQTADQQLLRGLKSVQGDDAKVAANSAKISLRALAHTLPPLLEGPATAPARLRFLTTGTAAARTLLDSAEVTLGNAERVRNKVWACLTDAEDGSCEAPDVVPLKDACSRISEQLALAGVALRAFEDCEETSGLKNILRKSKSVDGTPLAEQGRVLKESADALARQLPLLREMMFNKIHGSHRDADNQRALLTQAINDALESLDQEQWLLEKPHDGVGSTSRQLLDVVNSLNSMGKAPQEAHVHAAAAKAFAAALKLASDLAEEARERQDRLAGCLSGTGECVSSGDRADEAAETKKEVRAVASLVNMSQTALHLATLPEREECFREVAETALPAGLFVPGSTSWDMGDTLREAGDRLRVIVDAQQARGQDLLQRVKHREEELRTECQAVLDSLLRGLHTAVTDASELHVPPGVEEAKRRVISDLSSVMDELQELDESPSSMSQLQPTAERALLAMLESARDNVEGAEASSAKAAELLRNAKADDDEAKQNEAIAALREARAHGALAEAALQALYSCAANPWLRGALADTSVEVAREEGRKERVTAQGYGDELLQRLKGAKRSIDEMEKQSASGAADGMEVLDTMANTLRDGIKLLSESKFQSYGQSTSAKQAELEARLSDLQDAAEQGTGEAVGTAVAREVAASVIDISRSLGDEDYQKTADALVAKGELLVKDLLESVDDANNEADKLTAKHREGAAATEWQSISNFLAAAERAKDSALTEFVDTAKALREMQQHLERQAGFANISRDIANKHLGISGIHDVLEASGRTDELPSASDLDAVVNGVAPDAIRETEQKARTISDTVAALDNIAQREKGKLQNALARAAPVCLEHVKQETDKLLDEEAHHKEKLKVLLRIANNVMNKQKGRDLQPPSGIGGDVGVPGEEQMSAADLLKEASTRLVEFKAGLAGYSSRVTTLLSQTEDILRLLQKIISDSPPSPFAAPRRLSDVATLQAAAPLMYQIKDQLEQLQARINSMRREAELSVKTATSSAKNAGGQRNSHYIAVGLGIGLPLVLLAVGGCGYYHYRRRKGKSVTDLTTLPSGSEFQSSARTRGASGDLQVSRYDFVEPDSTFASFDPADLRGVRTLTSLETPDAGIPDTTRRQYMVDEHHVVATQVKQDAINKEQQFERVTL